MRIQYLAVIFVIIVLPISLVLSLYTGNLIKVSNTEAQYNRILFNATHDAVRTYQMNTLDNTYAAEDTSKFRDVNASINSFYNNLGTGLSRSGYSKEELYEYVPAILFNLYDGYYIYSPYQNIALENGTDGEIYGNRKNAYSKILLKRAAEKGAINPGDPPTINENNKETGGVEVGAEYLDYYNEEANLTNDPEFGLQNYNYYACEYKGKTTTGGDYDIIINYTLDNFIRVYGVVDGKFYNYEGYYIYTAGITEGSGDWTVKGIDASGTELGSVEVKPEMLGEYVAYYDPYTVYYHKPGSTNGQTQRVIYQKKGHAGINYFNYIVYNGVKYYLDTDHITLRTETEALDMSVIDAAGTNGDVNKGKVGGTTYAYDTNKFQYVRYYEYADEGDATSKTTTKEYNVSFNNTYEGIPIFKTEGKQRIYLSESELCDIIEYMNGYYNNANLAKPKDDPAKFTEFFGNIDTYWKDLNDVYYYKNAFDFSNKVNDNIFKKIKINLDPTSSAYSVVSDAYNMKYTAYFEFDEDEGKSGTEDERYYLHQKYKYANNTEGGVTYVFNSWGTTLLGGGTASLDLVNPDLDTSLFNQHRIDVITSCIEYSFANAVENFNDYMNTAYKYKIPDVSEADWGRICNNISCLTMMQGMPIGNYKFYNNYSLVVDNKVNEYTPKSGIYIEDNYQSEIGGGTINTNIPDVLKYSAENRLYRTGKYKGTREVIFHNPGCSEYSSAVGDTTFGSNRQVIGYRLIDYDIDSYVPPADLKGYLYYVSGGVKYPSDPQPTNDSHAWVPTGANVLGQQIFFYLRPGTGCYNCVVSQNKLDFSLDDILSFKKEVTLQTGGTPLKVSNNVRQAYFRALARERGAKSRFSYDTSGKKVFGSYQSD